MNKDVPVCVDCHKKSRELYGRPISIFHSHHPRPCVMGCGWQTYRRMTFAVNYSFAVEKHADEDAVVHGGEG